MRAAPRWGMSALNRKLLRDLWQVRGQALAIAFVIGAGIAIFASMLSTLDSLDLFQFFTALSIIRQENPRSACSLSVALEINGTAAVDYYLADFVLYKGALNAVPDSLRYNWFFWSRLNEYLHLAYPDRVERLVFSFSKNGSRVTHYNVRNRFLFLIADHKKSGYDSRYFGPVMSTNVFGRPLAVLWSFSSNHRVNLKRLGRYIP